MLPYMKVAQYLKDAEKPMMIVGGGVNNRLENRDQLYCIAQQADMPVATTLMGRGVFPSGNAYDLGHP